MEELAGFQSWLAGKGRKIGTVRTTSYNLKRVLRQSKLTSDGVASFLFQLQKEGKRNAYINHFVTALHLYGQYKSIPFLQEIKQLPSQPFLKATMSDEEIERFLAVECPQAKYLRGTKTLSPSWARWHRMTVFWSICAFTGMRTGEVAHLTVDDVDWGRNVFILEDTKTNEPRVVPIPPNIESLLREYMKSCTFYLFPSLRGGDHNGTGKVIDSVDWSYDFHKRRKMLGIQRKNLSPYSLRHSLITRLLEEDVNIFKVQKIVGHKRLETTAMYTHLSTKDIQEAIKKHPIIRRSTDPKNIIKSIVEAVNSFQLHKDKRFLYHLTETEESIEVKVCLA